MDFERVLANLNLYVFANWIHGELVDGPEVEKYWVTCTFMYPQKMMPDPRGGAKLLDYGCKITYEKSKFKTAVEVANPEDFEEGTHYPKMVKHDIWLVSVTIPRKLMSDIMRGSLDLENENIDLEELTKSYDEGLGDEDAQDTDEQDDNEQMAADQAAAPLPDMPTGAPEGAGGGMPQL